MDVFELRDQVVSDYGDYVRSFISLRDPRVAGLVDAELTGGRLWPEPLVQLNPGFERGAPMVELVEQGVLHRDCLGIFADKRKARASAPPLRLHLHQQEAILAAAAGDNYVLTTGTGSGKSLAYMLPIVNELLQAGKPRGLRALVVYPMNALANSQVLELQRYLELGFEKPPVSFARYTGQEVEEQRDAILRDPPNILLTNYVMLELMLTRPRERDLLAQAGDLRFLVLDELHTYRGRQGADVAMLCRRVRDATRARRLIHVGTSATLSGADTWPAQQQEVAAVASRVFGVPVRPERVIGETLRRVTADLDTGAVGFREALRERVADPTRAERLQAANYMVDPLAVWVENTLGLGREAGTGRWIRARSRPLRGPESATEELARATGLEAKVCLDALRRTLLRGTQLKDPEGRQIFAFRIHQFLSKGESVYATLDGEASRTITLQMQQFAPDSNRERILLPLAFCRECGQDYYVVRRVTREDGRVDYVPRDLSDRQRPDDGEPGFLAVSDDLEWPSEGDRLFERIPDDWIEVRSGQRRIKSSRRDRIPEPILVSGLGVEGEGEREALWFPSPFLLCLRCGVAYGAHARSDFGKLATLGSEGRSTATTVLGLAAVRRLRIEPSLEAEAQKLLSFTDNRQDAALQAGHFNDFIEIALLRSALYRAAQRSGAEGLGHDQLAARVFEALGLPKELYAANPKAGFLHAENADRAFRDVLGYYLYQDLRRGWRITSPNLEQCGLLRLGYLSLAEACRHATFWSGRNPLLAEATPGQREAVLKVLLDTLRRDLAIRVGYLDPLEQERIRQASGQHLIEPWAIDELGQMERARVVFPRSSPGNDGSGGRYVYLSPRGGMGRFLKRRGVLPEAAQGLKVDEVQHLMADLFEALVEIGLVHRVVEPRDRDDVGGYQLEASGMRWHAEEGRSGFHDPVHVPSPPRDGHRTNPFFVAFYQSDTSALRDVYAREHTAQVDPEEREDRERRFREGRLPILFCSPTMELGVDIRDLNVVNMRNVPPTPANYAQRSGRAGRGGQPAFLFTYCSAGSPHDQYFFHRTHLMVSGSVSTPRLDLGNEDLLRAHVHAIWLREARLDLGRHLGEVLDLNGPDPSLALRPEVARVLHDPRPRTEARARALPALGGAIREVVGPDGSTEAWLDRILEGIPGEFEGALARWRQLYRTAQAQIRRQTDVHLDSSRSKEDHRKAEQLIAEARKQLELLRETGGSQFSDFYSYRYFASEGFLPGYSFPRLPLSAYLRGRRRRRDEEEFVSRPRFVAISEFGPRAVIYHEGSRYEVNRVLLPPADSSGGGGYTRRASQCPGCAYLHPLESETAPDRCERCGHDELETHDNFFRMENVSTRRRDRINSDEEERLRLGYEIRTGLRFAERDGRPDERRARLVGAGGETLVDLVYGHTATIWRMNVGWRRRRNPQELGYTLDLERGYWCQQGRDEAGEEPKDQVEEALWSGRRKQVVPYVEDVRNVLLLETPTQLDHATFATLTYALQVAIQAEFQLEDSELAAEALPWKGVPRSFLLYEAAEGGAGVLRRLVEDPGCLARLGRKALEICHFDPETLVDLGQAPRSRERCEAACYDCLLSYYNQRDHRILDRQLLPEQLDPWRGARVESLAPRPDPGPRGGGPGLEASSPLARQWLDTLQAGGHRRPDKASTEVPGTGFRVDFLYQDQAAVILVESAGSPRSDQEIEALEDLGMTVLRFREGNDWGGLFARYPRLFGASRKKDGPDGQAVSPAGAKPTEPDYDLFDDEWLVLVKALVRDGLGVEPGEDLGSPVVGRSVAVVRRDERVVHLLDRRDLELPAVRQALAKAGTHALEVAPEDTDVGERARTLLGGSA